MRLKKVEAGRGLKSKLMFALVRLFFLNRMPDVVRTLWYRPKHFGRPFSDVLHQVMRGDSEWTAVERELFAAYTSKTNTCIF